MIRVPNVHVGPDDFESFIRRVTICIGECILWMIPEDRRPKHDAETSGRQSAGPNFAGEEIEASLFLNECRGIEIEGQAKLSDKCRAAVVLQFKFERNGWSNALGKRGWLWHGSFPDKQ